MNKNITILVHFLLLQTKILLYIKLFKKKKMIKSLLSVIKILGK